MIITETHPLNELIKRDYDLYCINTFYEPYRWHLGASIISNDCSRYLFYTFRWCAHPLNFNALQAEDIKEIARMHRLFQTGHNKEIVYKSYLEGCGFKVWTHDENGKQFRITALDGHYGGSSDGFAKWPAKYEAYTKDIGENVLLEFKTNNNGKGWGELIKSGLQVGKLDHYIQSSAYGLENKISHVLYINTNKNDDEVYIEVAKLNWQMAEQMKKKAARIIGLETLPQRISEDPSYWKCKYCTFTKICHEKQQTAQNCRSCKNAKPSEKAEWLCRKYNSIIPREEILKQKNCFEPIA